MSALGYKKIRTSDPCLSKAAAALMCNCSDPTVQTLFRPDRGRKAPFARIGHSMDPKQTAAMVSNWPTAVISLCPKTMFLNVRCWWSMLPFSRYPQTMAIAFSEPAIPSGPGQ